MPEHALHLELSINELKLLIEWGEYTQSEADIWEAKDEKLLAQLREARDGRT